jgi:hypothetical protein
MERSVIRDATSPRWPRIALRSIRATKLTFREILKEKGVEPFAKLAKIKTVIDGYRFAPPILRAGKALFDRLVA